MKNKLLIIAPRVIDPSQNKADKRLYFIIKSLLGIYDVHFLYIQTMFTNNDAIKNLEDIGVKLLSFHELKQSKDYVSKNIIQSLIANEKYQIIFFCTYLMAKYYLPSISSIPENSSLIAIDASKSHYLSQIISAIKSKDYYIKSNLLKNAEIEKMKEVSIYDDADIVIVDNEEAKETMLYDIPNIDIKNIPKYANNDEEIVKKTIEVFEKPAKKKANFLNNIIREVKLVKVGNMVDNEEKALGEVKHVMTLPSINVKEINYNKDSIVETFNICLKEIKSEFALITTDGVVVPEKSLNRMIFCAKSHPSHGIVLPSSNISLGLTPKLKDLNNFLEKHYPVNFGNWNISKDTQEYCFLIKRELVDAIGLLDSRFATLYYSFFDYFLKSLQAGYNVITVNESFVLYVNPIRGEKNNLEKDKKLLLKKWCDKGMEFLESIEENKHE